MAVRFDALITLEWGSLNTKGSIVNHLARHFLMSLLKSSK